MKETTWSEAVLRYTLMADSNPGAATEEMLLEAITNAVSFEDVVWYMVCNADNCFDELGDCGKLLIERMSSFSEERALQCTSFQEAYEVYRVELEPVHSRKRRMNYFDNPSLDYLDKPFRLRIGKLADQQIQTAKQTMDLASLARMYESAMRVEGLYNFEVPFKNAIQYVVQRKLEVSNNLSELVGLYEEAKNVSCDLAEQSISVVIAEFLLSRKGDES